MHHLRNAVLTLLVLFSLAAPPAETQTDKKRAPVPSAEQQAEATRLITGELFKDDIARAGKSNPVANASLAKQFLIEAVMTNDDPAGRYVLLNLARTHAELAADSETALIAIELMAKDFALPPREVLQKKVAALLTASKRPTSDAKGADAKVNPKAYQDIIVSAYQLRYAVVAEDDYATAHQLMQAAENAARKLRDVPQLSLILRDHEELNELEKKFDKWKPYAETLSKSPDDGPANFALGIYQALIKGNWERGLPMLAKASNSQFKVAAEADLANPTAAKKQLAVGDLWFDLAQKNTFEKLVDDKEFGDGPKIQMLLRAYHWNQEAVLNSSGKDRDQIEERQKKIMAMLPAEYAIGEVTTQYRYWDLSSPRRGRFVEPVYCAAFSPDSKKLIAAGADGVLHLFDIHSGKELAKLQAEKSNVGDSPRIWTVCFSSDGQHVLSGGFDGTIRLWDLVSRREVRRFYKGDYVRSVVASRDGKLVLSGGDDRKVRLWNEETGKEIRTFVGHEHFVWCVDLSRNSIHALSASLDRTVRLWDVASGKQLKVLHGHKDTVLSAVFTPDGRHALSGSSDKTMILWDLESGKYHVFPELPGYVNSVAVSPDGRRALSGGQDPVVFQPSSERKRLPHVLHLWDLQTAGKEPRVLRGHMDQVWHVAFSPDGRLALSCGQDGTVRVWSGSKYR